MTPVGKRPTRRLFWTFVMIFGVMTLADAVGVFWWWGVGFDEAEAVGMATSSTDPKMVASLWIAVAGVAGLIATAVVAAVQHARTPMR